ncbi:amino acid-binding ACT domain protein [Corynebacterium aquilae]|uniref:Amino acid-binding ACT domain protein n=1 Tax=Corynebacterium aquilae DSM 44791 TaxID=1431546 RepID=A0A1L7CFH9_9CORY|nr:amino acid-binding ACT domain protein [Corynebacterium aquilae]APT84586.1 amino acid-binding ACT domain protein [Corynebacterium aquilae DSM 44791]
MSYLLRVVLPDTPGSLGKLADALGSVEGNIQSVDVVHVFESGPDAGTAMDDIVVTLPPHCLPDSLISAAESIEGVQVDSIRPFSGTVDRRGQINVLALVAANRRNTARAMEELVNALPQSMTAGWAIALDVSKAATRVAASGAAPEDDSSNPQIRGVESARVLDPETETWIPESWALLDAALAATPIGSTGIVLVVGRPGGPDFLASEVEHLGNLGDIVGAILG